MLRKKKFEMVRYGLWKWKFLTQVKKGVKPYGFDLNEDDVRARKKGLNVLEKI